MAAHELRRTLFARIIPGCLKTDFKSSFGRAAWCSSSPADDSVEEEPSSGASDAAPAEEAEGIGETSFMSGMKTEGSSGWDQSHGGQREDMDVVRARVFGYHIGNGLRSGRKVLRKKLVGDKIASYYIEPIKDPLLLNLKHEAARVKLANLRRRGKGPPKKGQGKRTKK